MKHICPLCKNEYEKADLAEMTDEQVVKVCEVIGGESWKAKAEASLVSGQGDF